MHLLRTIGAILTAWADHIAAAIVEMFDRLVSPRIVHLSEKPDGGFELLSPDRNAADDEVGNGTTIAFAGGQMLASHIANMLRGSRIAISLSPNHFLFRNLELPAQAAGFLEGIIRAQIDRLTPWSANAVVFGFSAPKTHDAEHITAVVAAAPRVFAMNYVQAALAFRPASVALFTDDTQFGAGRIKIFEQKARGFLDVHTLSRAVRFIFAMCGLGALLIFAVTTFIDSRLTEQKDDIGQQIAQTQALLRSGGSSRDQLAMQALERRKYEVPPSSIVIEALSQVLPDHTYVTELHFVGTKIQVVGITRDAPTLIRLIEQSARFSRATFFAPTTRAASDPGERFHIEATLQPFKDADQ